MAAMACNLQRCKTISRRGATLPWLRMDRALEAGALADLFVQHEGRRAIFFLLSGRPLIPTAPFPFRLVPAFSSFFFFSSNSSSSSSGSVSSDAAPLSSRRVISFRSCKLAGGTRRGLDGAGRRLASDGHDTTQLVSILIKQQRVRECASKTVRLVGVARSKPSVSSKRASHRSDIDSLRNSTRSHENRYASIYPTYAYACVLTSRAIARAPVTVVQVRPSSTNSQTTFGAPRIFRPATPTSNCSEIIRNARITPITTGSDRGSRGERVSLAAAERRGAGRAAGTAKERGEEPRREATGSRESSYGTEGYMAVCIMYLGPRVTYAFVPSCRNAGRQVCVVPVCVQRSLCVGTARATVSCASAPARACVRACVPACARSGGSLLTQRL
ncbi:unnamed protein product [Xylocopa violacea]|uniref:Uncharacterized protein n=1 Tax=Xylocopa violacea TaxID=135666 RepID=A0ABP1P229_XYLVO